MPRFNAINPDLVSKASKLDPHRYYDDSSAKMAGFNNKFDLDVARNTALTDKTGFNQMQWAEENPETQPRPMRKSFESDNELGYQNAGLVQSTNPFETEINNAYDMAVEEYNKQFQKGNKSPHIPFSKYLETMTAKYGAKPGETYDTPWSRKNNRVNGGFGKESSILNKRFISNVGV